jgi:hypothetical protein
VSDYLGRKRIAYIAYKGHGDFLEALRVYHGWEWSVYDSALGRIVASGKTGINALGARKCAEAKWREYRNAPGDLPSIKWRY